MRRDRLRVLIVGGGGREHALAWKVAQSPRLERLYLAPGNAGTAALGTNLPLRADDADGLVAFTTAEPIDLVLIGPEAPLAAGLADALRAAGRRVFGPSQAAAQIEASESFAKDFMRRHRIPTAASATFTDFYDAVGHLLTVDFEQGGVVVKASGLAAGKGVVVAGCADDAEAALRAMMLDREFGAAGEAVVIEERLDGEEVSLLAFTDGITVRPMPPAQDHKRLLAGDLGPNTGGMGAYARAPVCPPPMQAELTHTILQPAVAGLRSEGRPFVGVLYAGLMLTPTGPRLLEFNCRFGDPETQAIMPLLAGDLLEVLEACVDGRLAEVEPQWSGGSAACVVMASAGYPASSPAGLPIHGLDHMPPQTTVFHAATALRDGQVVTAGGRVLGVTGWGDTLDDALGRAYAGVARVSFDGQQFRADIGRRALGVRP
jgi:phosphoribosylamine--glycine ligase